MYTSRMYVSRMYASHMYVSRMYASRMYAPRGQIRISSQITYPFPNFNGATVEVWEWISNFNPHLIMDVITYPRWNWIDPL